VAQHAARLIAAAYLDDVEEPDRDALALAALLAGYAIDGAWYGLSHVCSQTLVRVGGAVHGQANAVVLPHTATALRVRFPDQMLALDHAVNDDVESLAGRLAARAHASRIRDLGVAEDKLAECAAAASQRAELHMTPPPADEAELLAIYQAAWLSRAPAPATRATANVARAPLWRGFSDVRGVSGRHRRGVCQD
jgi:alcohol dehydrogenase class IV